VSNDGLVISGVSYSAVNPSRPVRWSSAGVAQALQLPTGYTMGVARSLSNDGSIAVGEVSSATVVMPVKWTATGTAQLLTLIPGCNIGYATGISIDGTMARWSRAGCAAPTERSTRSSGRRRPAPRTSTVIASSRAPTSVCC